MKALTCLVLAAMLAAVPAARAQTVLAASSAPPPPGSALPPPGIDDPGQQPQAVPLPDTGIRPSEAPAARQRDANGDSTDVAVHTNAQGDTVEEYKHNGQVYMVRITPRNGVPQTFMVNSPDGRLVRDPKLGPVSPVYYTIYQWGGSRKARPASASSGD